MLELIAKTMTLIENGWLGSSTKNYTGYHKPYKTLNGSIG
jgi:hypothetical protein